MYKPRPDLDFPEQPSHPAHAAPIKTAGSVEQPLVSGKPAEVGLFTRAVERTLLLASLLLVLAWVVFLARGAFTLLDWTLS